MEKITRRQALFSAAAGLVAVGGCGVRGGPVLSLAPGFPPRRWSLRESEKRLLERESPGFSIVERGPREASAVLRRLARPVPPMLDLEKIAARMERAMRDARGVGLAGPQVGLGLRIATLMLDYRTDHPKVIFVRNPVIVERSDRTVEGYEGCLSVPGVGGLVRRNAWVRVEHTAQGGSVESVLAAGANAVLWQHELDHLDGILYLDRLQGPLLPMKEVRRRREELRQREQKKGLTWIHTVRSSRREQLLL